MKEKLHIQMGLGFLILIICLVTITETGGVYQAIPGDHNYDNQIDNLELEAMIFYWASGRVSDADMLQAIDVWSRGR